MTSPTQRADLEHAENCTCMYPGDRECNCHLAYGFATAEAMDETDELARKELRQ